ncbi:STAS domain-containing protein [Polynucleobacter sp. MWH-UH19D]|uniref:STAS domain-containing protein n=1 Tax=Polynucleobacter sp. MWH-UH19D TaxID=1855610 RepID=UPI003364E3CB
MSFQLPATVTQKTATQLEIEGLRHLKSLTTVDCSRLKDFDSTVLAVLLAWRNKLKEDKQSLFIERAPEKLKVLAKVYGVSALLGI